MDKQYFVEDLRTPDDLIEALEAHQGRAEREVVGRLIGAAACLVVALAASGAVAKAAFVLCFLASAAFLWSLVDFTGRRWFLHHVVFQEVIRPRPDLAVELVEALLRVDQVATALQNPRGGEGDDGAGDMLAEEAESRCSAPCDAQGGDA